eukprot:gene41766-53935_t
MAGRLSPPPKRPKAGGSARRAHFPPSDGERAVLDFVRTAAPAPAARRRARLAFADAAA